MDHGKKKKQKMLKEGVAASVGWLEKYHFQSQIQC